MDQRALFFFVAACAAALIAPVTDEDLRYVPEILAVVYVLLAIASYLDWRTNKR
jgi:hypothetical protein